MDIEFNDREARRRLASVSAAVQGKKIAQALVAGALIIQNDAKRRAPYKTGTLRRSIHIGGHKSKAPGSEDAPDVPDPKISKGDAQVTVGTNLEYAARQEYGFDDTDSLERRYNQPARPYLRPAADENKQAVEREVNEAILDLIGAG